MSTTQPPTGDVVQISQFLNLVGGNWWVYDEANTLQTVTISCTQPFSDQAELLQIKVDPIKNILPDSVMEVTEVPERQYRWLKAILGSHILNWKERGLLLPAHWTVGETVKATSKEHDPQWGGESCEISLQLSKKPHQIPAKLHLPLPPSTLLIEIEQLLKDTSYGTHLIQNTLTFAEKIGLVHAQGQDYGVFHVFSLKTWSGMH
jgi:hypothetical protein